MSIVLTLKEQCSLGFTGRVNILLRDNGQYVGEVLILDGILVGARYNAARGTNALFRAVFDDLESEIGLKMIVEPEVVENAQLQFSIEFDDFKKEAESRIQQHRDAKTMRPPNSLALKVRPEFIDSGEEVSLMEFEILCSLIGKKTVGEVYGSLPLMESDITKGLVTLRKKNAFSVKQGQE